MTSDGPPPRWRVLTDARRPWWKRLAAQTIAQVDVHAPDGQLYLVRVVRTGRLVGGSTVVSGVVSGSPDPRAIVQFVRQVSLRESGWVVRLLRPAGGWTSERLLLTQPVAHGALMIDIVEAVVDAVARGDRLWPDD